MFFSFIFFFRFFLYKILHHPEKLNYMYLYYIILQHPIFVVSPVDQKQYCNEKNK